MNEQEKFLKDLIPDSEQSEKNDVLEKPLDVSEEAPEKEESEGEFQPKNRRERRLLIQNQRLREEAIATTARLQGIEEAKGTRENTEEADYLKLVERIYGNVTPEAREATEILKKALQGVHNSAKAEALKETVETIERERTNETQEVQKEENNLDEMMDELEETHNANFSDESERKGFLSLLEKVSPKDNDGNIIEYADPETVYELYESRKDKSSKAKDLAGRSMVRSGMSQPSKIEEDATVRFLKDNGII